MGRVCTGSPSGVPMKCHQEFQRELLEEFLWEYLENLLRGFISTDIPPGVHTEVLP